MNVKEAASLVSDIVGGEGEILGAHLAHVLKEREPDWDVHRFSCSSLSNFIAQHVQSVYVSGRSGRDYIYKRTPEGEPSVTIPNPNFWRAWVSPNGRYVLVIDPATGKVQAQARKALTPAGHLRLAPPGIVVHQELAREFLKKTSADTDGKLEALIVSDKPTWWQAWYGALQDIGLASQWNAFRRQQLQLALRREIEALQLSPPGGDVALSEICGTDNFGQSKQSDTTGEHTIITGERIDTLARARTVAIRAIEQMSEQELRELRLPLGLILDIVRAKA